jgi:hypothetical protein
MGVRVDGCEGGWADGSTVYTQMVKSNPITDERPPSPQFWGSRTLKVPQNWGI